MTILTFSSRVYLTRIVINPLTNGLNEINLDNSTMC